MTRECDVLIVGGGLVGTVLANALTRLSVRTALVESRDPSSLAHPGFDARVTALAHGSQRMLAQLGLWSAVDGAAEAIRSIHISERGRFGAARIEAREHGVEALGYTVENSALARAFWEPLRACAAFSSLAPGRLDSFSTGGGSVLARVEHDGGIETIAAKLLVAADGARSSVRDQLGIAAREDDYAQRAIVVNCTTEVPPRGRAYERFTSTGPLAFLPLSGGRVGVVWTLDGPTAARTMALGEDAFRAELQQAFGHRLGRLMRVGERSVHDLRRVRSEKLGARRALLLGSAAVNLHPVAGQGFNLALRDVAILAELVADAVARDGPEADIGAHELLERYRGWRVHDQRTVAGLTHGLVRGFELSMPGAGMARGVGLAAFDIARGAKALLARQTMGKAGRLPRLTRGLDL